MQKELSENMQSAFNPLVNTFQNHSNMMQQLMREQIEFANECIEVNMRASDKLHDSQQAGDYLRVSAETGREITEKWMALNIRQWGILMEAGNSLNNEVQSAARETQSAITQASRAAERHTGQAADRVEQVAGQTEEVGEKKDPTEEKAEQSASKATAGSKKKSS